MPHTKGKAHSPRNKVLIRGLRRYGRGAAYHKNGSWAVKNKNVAAKAKETPASTITKPFGKKGQNRQVAVKKAPRHYAAPGEAIPRVVKKVSQRAAAVRASITPGTVLILLAGKHQGKRVVFLKQLPSGLLLVTGPYKLNGVPLRRVDQAYVIATSTKVDLAGVKVDEKYNDAYFKRAVEKKKKTEDQFFAQETAATTQVDAQKVADQKAFDKPLLDTIKKTPLLAKYLSTRFSLTDSVAPHALKF